MTITHILTDIEGTTSPAAFVTGVLFPYAAEHLEAFIAERGDEPAVARHLDRIRCLAGLAGCRDGVLAAELRAWIAADRKDPDLKAIQGLIWEAGYRSGRLVAEVYADVPVMLSRWRSAGLELAVFSSGSAHAQRLFFAHTGCGDLGGLFSAHFDTTIGAKREAASYERICAALGVPDPRVVLFLSDTVAELDAADEAGLMTHLVCRGAAAPGTGHPMAGDFHAIDRHWDLADSATAAV